MFSRRPRRPQVAVPWTLASLAIGVALVATGWTVTSGSRGGRLPAQGGSYVEGSVGPPPERINPLFAAATGPERDVTALIFSGLIRPGPDGEPEPDLAESWVASTDATSFTFILRPNVTWQDGRPFDADDVVFTATAFAAPGVKGDPSVAEVWRRARVQKLGQLAVLFEFDAPFAPFLSYASAGILPRHLLAKDSPQQLVNDGFNLHPIGTGPYTLKSLTRTGAELRRDPAYHLGTPYLDSVHISFLPDQATLVRSIEAGRIDAGLPLQPLATTELAALGGSGRNIRFADRPAYSLVYLNLNLAQFQDPAVRRALSQATDRTAIVSSVMANQAVASDVPIPGRLWSDPQPPRQNAAAARATLQAAGWAADADGTLRRRGIALAFTLLTSTDPQRQAIATALASQWAAIGVKVTIQTASDASLLNDSLVPHKYETVLFGWDPGPDPDLFTAWHSNQQSQQIRNLSGYTSERADQLLDTLRQTTDQADRGQLYTAFAQTFRQDMPAIVLFFPRFTYVAPAGLTGTNLGLLAAPDDRFAGIEVWSRKTRRN